MKTYTIVGTGTWEFVDNNYISNVFSMIPEADIDISYKASPSTGEYATLNAGKGITISKIAIGIYVKGTAGKKVYFYDGAIATVSAQGPLSGLGSPEGTYTSRYPGDQYLDATSGILYMNPNLSSNSGWEIIQTAPL